MRWLWIYDPGEGRISRWTAHPDGFYRPGSPTTLLETERIVIYNWHEDTRILIREDLATEIGLKATKGES